MTRIAHLAALCMLSLAYTVHAYEYLGCYKDQFAATERDLVGSLLLNDDSSNLITPDYCEDYCGKHQFEYVGVQYGSECWCGHSYGKHGKVEEKDCNVPCVGDKSLVNRCGGALTNSVYKVTKTFPKPPPHPNDGRPLLGLVMIVKDEAHTLPNTLAPLAPFIDTYYILDTGSTDGTQAAIKKTLGDKGEVWEEPFIDYGRSRNRALEIAQTAKNPPIFSLMLSADETVHHPQALRSFCEQYRNAEGAMHEAYPIQMDVGWKFDSMRLSRTDKGWRYVGRVHEYLASPDGKWKPSLRVPTAFIQFHVTDPERRGKREYKIRDILLDEIKEKPRDTRASFYLARTYNVIGNHSAAMDEFKRRISLGGWQEEVYESYYAIAFQLEALGRPWSEVQMAFMEAHNHSPERGEPLFNIAQHYWNTPNQKALTYPFAALCASLRYPKEAVLWVQADVYNYQCLMYQGLSGYQTKHYLDGYTALLKALQVQKNDWTMQQAKGPYEAVLSQTDRLKAECTAGVKFGEECKLVRGDVPCPTTPSQSAVDPAGPTSVKEKMANTPVNGEQGNVLTNGRESINTQHIPQSLKNKYGPDGFYLVRNIDERGKYYAQLGFFGGIIVVFLAILAFFLIRQSRACNWLGLKVFGGKKATIGGGGGGAGGDGGKFV